MPGFTATPINGGISGWLSILNQNFSRLQAAFNGPTLQKRMYRVSAGHTRGTVGFLVDFSPVAHKGCQVWVEDAAGDANFGVSDQQFAYSNGTKWKWLHNDLDLSPNPS